MMGAYHVIASVLFLAVIIREGFALECVECNSIAQDDCDQNPLKHSVICPSNATSCRKMEQEIYYEGDYQTRTIRQCAFESGPKKCIERTGTYRFKVWYCHCDDNNCNSAGALSISAFLALFSAAVAFVFKL